MAAWISDCEEIVDEKTDFLLCVTIQKWHLYVRWTLWYAADERTRNLRLVLMWFYSVQVIISIGWCFSRHEFRGKIYWKFFFSATALPLPLSWHLCKAVFRRLERWKIWKGGKIRRREKEGEGEEFGPGMARTFTSHALLLMILWWFLWWMWWQRLCAVESVGVQVYVTGVLVLFNGQIMWIILYFLSFFRAL